MDKNLAEFVQSGGEKLRPEIRNTLILFGAGEFPEQWKESVIVTIYNEGDKTDCSNYQGISL
jgi:hypothetical protein